MTTLTRLVVRKQVSAVGGPAGGTQYDLTSACRLCGTGARQAGPLLLSGLRSARFRMFSTLDDEILCDAELAKVLEDRDLGHCLGDVLDSKSLRPLPFRQLVAEATMPRFSSESSGLARERACPACDRDGYFGIPRVAPALRYTGLEPRICHLDLLETWERFGNSRLREPFSDSVFAAPLYVAGERLQRVLEAERVPGVDFESILIS